MLLNRIALLSFLLLVGIIICNTYIPEGLDLKSWELFIIFLLTVLAVVIDVIPIGIITLISLTICVMIKIFTIKQALAGFGLPVVWLVVFAFFISKGIIKSQLGKRIAYFFITKLGSSHIGISYGLIIAEFIISPMIPSASARGGGVIYPVAKSVSEECDQSNKAKIKEFLMQICFHTNIITSSMFLTAMAGNSMIATLALGIGVEISWAKWAYASIVPGICSLIILPHIIHFLTKPKYINININLAKIALKEMGPLSRDEIIMIATFALLLSLWATSSITGIDNATTAMLGFLIITISGVITWDDAISAKDAWKTFIWFAGFVTLSTAINDAGIITWINKGITASLDGSSQYIAITFLIILFFYMHYFFASITVYASVMYIIFANSLIALGISPIASCLILAFLANLSACLTHYGIASAPAFFESSNIKMSRWWYNGFIVSIAHLIIWGVIGTFWWGFVLKIL